MYHSGMNYTEIHETSNFNTTPNPPLPTDPLVCNDLIINLY